jgi:uncharacterized membrane protein
MHLNYKQVLLFQSISLISAGFFCAVQAVPERDAPPILIANHADLSSSDSNPNPKSNEDSLSEGENDPNQAVKHKGETVKTDKDKADTESKVDANAPFRGGSRRAFDSFRNNPLNLAPLNLTTEQKDKIQTMRKESGKKARSIRSSLKAKRAEMCDLMFDPKSTNKEILKVHNEARKLHEQADDLMVQDFLAIRELLTPEQKAHLPEIKPAPKDAERFDMRRSSSLARPSLVVHERNPG